MNFTLDHGYLAAFLLGVGYALVSGAINLIAGAGHGDVDLDHDVDVGHDVGAGHDHEFGHDADMDSGDGAVHFSPISPVTISMFVSTFGGVGLVLSRACHMPGLISLPVAAVSAFVVAAGVFYLFYTIFRVTQGSSEAHVSSLRGLEAEVTTTIPAEGLGEIAYVSRGTRYTGSARSDDRKPHPANSTVVISRVVGGIFCVTESLDEELRSLGGKDDAAAAESGDSKKKDGSAKTT